jgi:ketosteroid isomerase-like protein
MGRLAELTGGSLRSEVIDILANDRRAVVLQLTRGERDGRPPLNDREVIVYDLRDGRVVEVWEHPGDLVAMDAFFA